MTATEPGIAEADAVAGDRFAPAAAVANAVVYEGYVLYPYRLSSNKNQCRWQFGVLAPPDYAKVDPYERTGSRTEYLLVAGKAPVLHTRVRLLHLQRRALRAVDVAGAWREVQELDTGTTVLSSWDEAVEVVIDLPQVQVPDGGVTDTEIPIQLGGAVEYEDAFDQTGALVGQIVRTRQAVEGRMRLRTCWVEEDQRLLKIALTVENLSGWSADGARREDMVPFALVAVHTMMGVDDGEFVSSLDPLPAQRQAVKACRNEGAFPVLAGPEGSSDLVLSSPIILYDHPAVAPESPGDLYDACEIDEILALRILAMTDGEKAEARALDPRAAAIVDRTDAMTPEGWASLHGTIRSFGPVPDSGTSEVTGMEGMVPWDPLAEQLPSWDPRSDTGEPAGETIQVNGVDVTTGTKVVVRPSHRADAQDLFVAGKTATVAGVFRDVNGIDILVAVTIDDDPATELLLLHGRYLYFHPDEVEPIVKRDGAP